MSQDSTTLPLTANPPGQATLYTAEKTTTIPDPGGTVTTTDIEFDYSAHLDRIVTALEQLSLSVSLLTDEMQYVRESLINMSTNSTVIRNNTNTMVQKCTTDTNNLQDIRNVVLSDQQGPGVPIRDVYSSIAYSTLIKLFEDEGIDINALIAKTKAQLDGSI